ncbi:MAG: TlpA family protein disulfide reductase [Rhodocyclaceae bacterium]|nr:TlpA family protein disulfide reductase [Rhodocyclaceae bacterium]MBX3671054.1 TlpA family protein disulfide reductase [Rhodocyclaceae bacterium]
MGALRVVLVLAVALVAAGAGFYFGAERSAPADRGALTELQQLRLPDAAGKERALAEWRGQLLVVNFWATWCPPCREEMPAFSRLQEKLRGDGVRFVGIAVDEADRVRAFAAAERVSYPLLVANFDVMKLMSGLGNRGQALPYTLVLDKDGEIAASRLGVFPEAELEKLLRRLAKPGH